MAVAQCSPLTTRAADEVIAYADGESVTVGAFVARASSLAQRLPEAAYAINLSSDRYEFLLGFCAAIIAGQCTLLPQNRQRNTILDVAAKFQDSYVLGGPPVEELRYCEMTGIDSSSVSAAPPVIADEQLCAIVFTSGSTGDSRPNRKFWKTLREGSVSNAALALDFSGETLSLVATVPPQHMWGLEMTILLPLFAAVAVSSRTPFFPQDVVESIGDLPRPRGLVSSPVHLNAVLGADAPDLLVDRIYSATAPMSVGAARELERKFGARFVEIFGCSESGIIAARRTSSEEEWHLAEAFRLKSAGSDTLVMAEHLEADVRLNDRVEILAPHRFRWLGRDDDMINVAGKRGSIGEINQRLNALPGVSDGVVFLPDGDAQRLAALVVAPTLQPSDILAGLRQSIDPAFLPRPILMVPALPRQETGKLPRGKVIETFNELRAKNRAELDHGDEKSSPGS